MFNILPKILGRKDTVVKTAVPARPRIDLDAAELPTTIYAIGDVHGCLDLLIEAENKIYHDAVTSNGTGLIIMLGDYVDRGPDSAGVLEHLSNPPPGNLRRVMLCGNHEAAFLDFMEDPAGHMDWIEFGGRQTLFSYGIDADHFITKGRRGLEELKDAMRAGIPERHRALMASLPIYLKTGAFVFVHAGLRPGLPLASQNDRDMMWIREPFLTRGPELPLVVVHGHTPSTGVKVGPRRIGIDTAAVSTGRLTVLRIAEGRARLLGE